MRYLKTLLLVLLLFLSTYAQAFVAPATVEVESQEWGDADPKDVRAVLQSVIEVISPYMAKRNFGNILVGMTNASVSLYEKGGLLMNTSSC